MPKLKLPALPRWASVAKSSGTTPKPPDVALRATSRSSLAIPPRPSTRGILAKASDLKCLKSSSRRADRLTDPASLQLPLEFPARGQTTTTLFMVRLCPSIHTFSHERIPSGHSGERAIPPRPSVRASSCTCESNHYAALPNRPARLRSPVHTLW
jgi:hypothetical protein